MEIFCADNMTEECLKIRYAVFVVEQGVPPELEKDEFDEPGRAEHFILSEKGRYIGTFRCIDEGGGVVHFGRFCILPEYRGLGFGAAALAFTEAYYREKGKIKITLGAQCHAIPFYEKNGFKVVSDIFDDAGIPHREMIKLL